MGWGANRVACWTLDAINDAINAQNKELLERGVISQEDASSNTFSADGKRYFYETGREQADGAITGTIWRLENGLAHRTSRFRIDPDGKVVRGPKLFKACAALILYLNGCEVERFIYSPCLHHLELTLEFRAKSFMPTGCNRHVPYQPVLEAEVRDLDGNVLVRTPTDWVDPWVAQTCT